MFITSSSPNKYFIKAFMRISLSSFLQNKRWRGGVINFANIAQNRLSSEHDPKSQRLAAHKAQIRSLLNYVGYLGHTLQMNDGVITVDAISNELFHSLIHALGWRC
jgi:hypothetical protein